MKRIAFALASTWLVTASAVAQPVAPRIGPLVLDLRLTFPRFPDAPQLAASRNIDQADLPGLGRGIDLGAHVYVFKWRAVKFGVGFNVMTSRSHKDEVKPATPSPSPTPTPTPTPSPIPGPTPTPTPPPAGRAVTEKLTALAPQISFNFGNGYGWSYISGGLGLTKWFLEPDLAEPVESDQERIKTINYGGGARWFPTRRVAFSFDVRFYAINPGKPNAGFGGSPRTTLLVIGAGVSIKP